jgi:hypothetical protein
LVIKSALPEEATSTDDLVSNHVYIASNRLRGCLRQFGGDTAMPSLSPTCVGVGCDCLRNGAYWPYWFAAYYIRDIDPTDDEPPTLSRMVMEWDAADGMTVVAETLSKASKACAFSTASKMKQTAIRRPITHQTKSETGRRSFPCRSICC